MLVKWHIGLSLRFKGVRRIASVKPGKALKDLKQSRDTGTAARKRLARIVF
jgi:hypothetical protein